MEERRGDGGTGRYLTSAFLNPAFSLGGMLSSSLDKFEVGINRQCPTVDTLYTQHSQQPESSEETSICVRGANTFG